MASSSTGETAKEQRLRRRFSIAYVRLCYSHMTLEAEWVMKRFLDVLDCSERTLLIAAMAEERAADDPDQWRTAPFTSLKIASSCLEDAAGILFAAGRREEGADFSRLARIFHHLALEEAKFKKRMRVWTPPSPRMGS